MYTAKIGGTVSYTLYIEQLLTSTSFIIINNNHIKNLIQEISRKSIIDFYSYTTDWSLCAILNVPQIREVKTIQQLQYFSVYLQIQLRVTYWQDNWHIRLHPLVPQQIAQKQQLNIGPISLKS